MVPYLAILCQLKMYKTGSKVEMVEKLLTIRYWLICQLDVFLFRLCIV